MFAYLDAAGNVVALSSTARDLASVQATLPEVVERVDGAPDGLGVKESPRYTVYHQRIAGQAGTDLSHYTAIDNLGPLRAAKIAEIDARTEELIAQGFEFPPASGQRFSLSTNAQRTLLAADVMRDDPSFTYPVNWNTLDDTGVLTVADSATLHNFVLTAVGTVRSILDAGTALKDAVRAATSRAEIDAVVDNR